MAANKGSFAQRMGSMAASIENWDDDGDFEGPNDLFTHSMSTVPSMSSRASARSESNTGDDDWQLLITPNDELSTHTAISSAKQAGVPIPKSVPSSALLGGSIKRLGKKKSSRKLAVDDDWGEDLELPANANDGLKLKAPVPRTPAEDQDEFDDWGEGSLGIRFAGTKREGRGARSSSVSAMSPSMGSCMTLESEDDDLTGLLLPTEPLDFKERLDRLKKSEHQTPDVSPFPQSKREPPPTSAPAPPVDEPVTSPPLPTEPVPEPKLKQGDDEEDFLEGLDFGGADAFDSKKPTLNRNVVVKKPASKPAAPPAARPATTLTFTDKPSGAASSRIPRPLSTSRSRLTPVYETGASNIGQNRPMPTTTSAQLLRAKRSAPLLRNNNNSNNANNNGPPRAQAPFRPAGASNSHATTKASQPHLRRDSDPRRPQSPALRTHSRVSSLNLPDTPSRAGGRRELAPSALARHPPPQKLTQPKGRKKQYGDGNELEIFDDLPTSATKEKQYEKTPRNAASNKSLRQQPSSSRLPMPDRMATPLPQTPKSPPRMDSTPRFARDTAASRNAREQRLAGTRSRGEGPIMSRHTNWQTTVALRSPQNSPSAHRKRNSGQGPKLIRAMASQPNARTEKGMTFNPTLQRWEGNDEALAPFSHPNTSTTTLALTTASTPTFAPPNHPLHPSHDRSHDRSHSISHTALATIQAAQKNVTTRAVKVAPAPAPSPPRPALISQISAPRNVQYEGKMVFDPVKMSWIKAPRLSNDPRSPSVDMDDEEDPFAGLDDLKDNESVAGTGNNSGLAGTPNLDDAAFVGEEFDLGPSFIRRQREEEAVWRRKTEGWVGMFRDSGEDKNGGWRWALRDLAMAATAESSMRD